MNNDSYYGMDENRGQGECRSTMIEVVSSGNAKVSTKKRDLDLPSGRAVVRWFWAHISH
jgi:hypothetical protein